jgi:phosphoserine phosphatase
VAYQHAVLAVVFDFDDTLVPDSTTKLLVQHKIDPEKFWEHEVTQLVKRGYDQPLAYLRLLLDLVGPDKPLGKLTLQGLREFGGSLDDDFYPGLPDMFTELQKVVADYPDISIEFYIISGGLEEIVNGSSVVRKYFKSWYGCRLDEDPKSGLVAYISRCITFTEKTRYLFEINKGVSAKESYAKPYLVNKNLPPADRRIPFRNIIYVGDGLTDIPCFSLVKKEGGLAFGVFQPGKKSSANRALTEFLAPGRVITMNAPRYRPEDDLGALLRAAVENRCSKIALEREEA